MSQQSKEIEASRIMSNLMKHASAGGCVPPLSKFNEFRAKWLADYLANNHPDFDAKIYFTYELRELQRRMAVVAA